MEYSLKTFTSWVLLQYVNRIQINFHCVIPCYLCLHRPIAVLPIVARVCVFYVGCPQKIVMLVLRGKATVGSGATLKRAKLWSFPLTYWLAYMGPTWVSVGKPKGPPKGNNCCCSFVGTSTWSLCGVIVQKVSQFTHSYPVWAHQGMFAGIWPLLLNCKKDSKDEDH